LPKAERRQPIYKKRVTETLLLLVIALEVLLIVLKMYE